MGFVHQASQIGKALLTALVSGKLRVAWRRSSFPRPVGSVITLGAGEAWWIVNDVDLGGDRLVASGPITLFGLGTEATALTSTGLASGEAILSSSDATQIRTLTINVPDGCVGLRLDGTGQPNAACDWTFVNFGGVGRAAELTNPSNVIGGTLAFFADGLALFGGVGTLGISDTIFTPGDGQCGLCVDAGSVVTRRIRLDKCAVIADTGAKGVEVMASSISASERFILSQVDFSGPGSYLGAGLTAASDKARFYECRGVENSSRLGEMYWTANATPTAIALVDTFYPISGTSLAGSENSRFEVDGNDLVYTGALNLVFHVSAVVSLTGTNNQVAGIAIFRNGSLVSNVVSQTTLNGAGRAENVAVHAAVRLTTNDRVSLRLRNQTLANDITVTDLDVLARPAS